MFVPVNSTLEAIQNEQTIATRAIIQGREACIQNREQTPAESPERSKNLGPILRYPGLPHV